MVSLRVVLSSCLYYSSGTLLCINLVGPCGSDMTRWPPAPRHAPTAAARRCTPPESRGMSMCVQPGTRQHPLTLYFLLCRLLPPTSGPRSSRPGGNANPQRQSPSNRRHKQDIVPPASELEQPSLPRQGPPQRGRGSLLGVTACMHLLTHGRASSRRHTRARVGIDPRLSALQRLTQRFAPPRWTAISSRPRSEQRPVRELLSLGLA